MKAILCTHFGGPDELELKDVPDPTPASGEVVVAVKSAALNFFDTLLIAGKYQFKPPFPFSPASEFAGVVERVGAGVTDLQAGDRVLGYGGHGAAREKVAITRERVVPIPDALDFDRAAGLTVIYGTTLHALKDRAHLKSGETLAVLGASGGTGLAAIELGKLMGARVIACASSDDKLAFCKARGADAGINYASEDLKEALRRVTSGKGADVIYDPVGGPYAEAALRAIAWAGRFLVIGFAAGEIPKIPLNLALLKGCDIVGVFWGAFTERDPQGHQANMAELVRFAAEGKLSAHVHATYPLSETPAALKAIAQRKVMGKVILKP
ncbi:MAG TPA: NADPH:quinone oxidoreductase family protein [Xanthobacteraceae bacterium]|nr:NADPH:quinone oxidoreductase family protein [Xanthobacteraceae bacterium]